MAKAHNAAQAPHIQIHTHTFSRTSTSVGARQWCETRVPFGDAFPLPMSAVLSGNRGRVKLMVTEFEQTVEQKGKHPHYENGEQNGAKDQENAVEQPPK